MKLAEVEDGEIDRPSHLKLPPVTLPSTSTAPLPLPPINATSADEGIQFNIYLEGNQDFCKIQWILTFQRKRRLPLRST